MKAECRQGGFFVCQATARWMTNLLSQHCWCAGECILKFAEHGEKAEQATKCNPTLHCIAVNKVYKVKSGWPALALGLAAVHNMDDQLQLCIAPRRLTLFLSKINGKATGYSSPTANICFPVNACFATKYSGGINLDFCKFFFGRSVQLHATSHPS